ncbi:hypothetical protein PGB90_007475 [Kerria lacca]
MVNNKTNGEGVLDFFSFRFQRGWCKFILWLIVLPVYIIFSFTIPGCNKKRLKNWFPLTFTMCIIRIGSLSYIVAWIITIIGNAFKVPNSIMGITFLAADVFFFVNPPTCSVFLSLLSISSGLTHICFKSFGQLCSNESDVFSQFRLSVDNKAIKFITLSWSKCYIVLDNGDVLVQGFVDSKIYHQRQLILPFQVKVKKITCLRRYDIFLTEDGSCWKYSLNEQWIKIKDYIKIANDKKNAEIKIIDIDSNDELHVALSSEGLIFNFPFQIEMPLLTKVTKVSCGLEHCICLTNTGSVFGWGSGSRGQLGNGLLNFVEQPELLVALDGLIVIDVDAGGWHSAAVTDFGDFYSWGWNNFGQLGFLRDKNITENENNDRVSVLSEPKVVDWPDKSEVRVKQISCGTKHTVVLLDDGLVWGCGCNKYGQINPASKQKYFDKMELIPVSDQIDIYKIFCISWYTVLYVDCKKSD